MKDKIKITDVSTFLLNYTELLGQIQFILKAFIYVHIYILKSIIALWKQFTYNRHIWPDKYVFIYYSLFSNPGDNVLLKKLYFSTTSIFWECIHNDLKQYILLFKTLCQINLGKQKKSNNFQIITDFKISVFQHKS